MQITRETDYAVRCVLYLSVHSGKVVMRNEITRARKIPKSFLAKILQKLAKAGIVKSFRGARGGVKLIKNPENISLLNIIETIEGPVGMNVCAVNRKRCSLSDRCSVHPAWADIRKAVEDILKEYNFKKLSIVEIR